MLQNRSFAALCALVVLVAVAAMPAAAESETPGWYYGADVGGVWTGGNSESIAIGAGAQIRRIWPDWRLTFSGVASQTETTNKSRSASGTVDDYEVDEVSVTEKTAEYYNALALASYDISEHFFALGGIDWMRNRPAGIESRTLLALGAGNTWFDTDARSLRTYYNFTYTFQDDVVSNPITKSDFPGLQFGYGYKQQVSETARIESDAVVDFNLDNSDDVRVNWFAAFPVSLSERLELKPSLRVLWRNDPSLEELTLFDGGGTEIGKVLEPLDEFDTIFTLALVIKFAPSKEG